jgi:AcrR family transcriptional regulator
MLCDALAKLLKQKQFGDISVGDIAEASTLNRATFYDHYSDKSELLQNLVACQFRELIVERQIRFEGCEGAVKNVAMGVCYYLSEMTNLGSEGQRQADMPIETAIVSVVRGMILEGLGHHLLRPGAPVELTAATIAWAIYGAAREWVRTPNRQPVPEVAETIERMITPMFSSLI